MKKRFFSWFFTAALLAFFSVAQASPVTFATGSGTFKTLGLEAGYPSDYDHLQITGGTGYISGTNTYDIADLLFTVGYNAWHIHDAPPGNFDIDFAIGGTHATLTIPYTLHIDYSDTLRLGVGTLSLINNGYLYQVATKAVDFVNVGLSPNFRTADLLAEIKVSAVPLPPAILLMLPGLGLLGFMSRRNKKKEV